MNGAMAHTAPTAVRSPTESGVRRVVFALIVLLVAPTAVARQAGAIEESIRSLIAAHKLEDANVAYHIEDTATGEVIASRQAESALLPASSMKVLTTGAALVVLGPDFAFRTRVHREGPVVTIVGDGDPALGDPEVLRLSEPPLTIEGLFEAMADAALSRGDGPIRGVRVDASVFDRELVHPTWDTDDLNKHYAAQVSGLNTHTNNFYVFPSPGQSSGDRAEFSTQPRADWVAVTNRARTTSRGNNTAWLSRSPGRNEFTLHGSVVRRQPWPIRIPLHTPSVFGGRLLAAAIERRQPGSTDLVSGVALLGEQEAKPQGDPVAVVSTPLQEVLIRCNRDSQNLYAEALFKRMGFEVTGRSGSWSDGAAVMRMVISERLGPTHAASLAIADGSGLSRGNKVAPATMTAWLRSFYGDAELRDPLVSSLATPGEGTFTRRFRNMELENSVHGKSGSLTGVRTLSGYVIHPQTGRAIAFAIFVNKGEKGSVAVNARDFADKAVGVIDRWLTQEEAVGSFGG